MTASFDQTACYPAGRNPMSDSTSDFLGDENNSGGSDAVNVSLSGSALREAIEEKSGIPVLISR